MNDRIWSVQIHSMCHCRRCSQCVSLCAASTEMMNDRIWSVQIHSMCHCRRCSQCVGLQFVIDRIYNLCSLFCLVWLRVHYFTVYHISFLCFKFQRICFVFSCVVTRAFGLICFYE